MNNSVYLVFIHKENGLLYGGYFSTREKADNVCKEWNRRYQTANKFADFINVTDERDNQFILNISD